MLGSRIWSLSHQDQNRSHAVSGKDILHYAAIWVHVNTLHLTCFCLDYYVAHFKYSYTSYCKFLHIWAQNLYSSLFYIHFVHNIIGFYCQFSIYQSLQDLVVFCGGLLQPKMPDFTVAFLKIIIHVAMFCFFSNHTLFWVLKVTSPKSLRITTNLTNYALFMDKEEHKGEVPQKTKSRLKLKL